MKCIVLLNTHTIAQLLLKKVITREVYMKPELLLVCLGLLQQLGAWEDEAGFNMQPRDKKVGKKIPFTTKNLDLFRPIFLKISQNNPQNTC